MTKKSLQEMTLQELWELFPIILTGHNADWAEWYEEESRELSHYLPMDDILRISHIGSTAISNICAKPIIDLLVEVKQSRDLKKACEAAVNAGYTVMSSDETRMSLNKGYTREGFAERVFHLHLRCQNDNDELYFRDFLNEHAELAREYENLKRSLWKLFEHDRDGYTESKTDFVKQCTSEAKAMYGDRYRSPMQ